ncbi:MAG: hypothetical protein IJZ29_05935 [Clostridia bacterium]|nr:hypothetical protein [Clostridia bacterium]
MYIFRDNNQTFQGNYISCTDAHNNTFEVITRLNIETLISNVLKTKNKDRVKIMDYLNNEDVIYRLGKKYLTIDFNKMNDDACEQGIDITKGLEEDFEKLSTYVVEQIKQEPLILNFPFRDYKSNDYFIKSKYNATTNKIPIVKQINIGTERLHRICATIKDEYIVSLIETLFKSDLLYTVLNDGNYLLNYEVIYNNFENLNPYAFEEMIKEMFEKLHLLKSMQEENYLPNNRYYQVKGSNKVPLTKEEAQAEIKELLNTINEKIENTTNNKVCPIYSKSTAKLALDLLSTELNKSEVIQMLASGELVFKNKNIIKDLQPNNEFNYNLLNLIISLKLSLQDITEYYQKTSTDDFEMCR